MTYSDVWHLLIQLPWVIFLIYWIIGAFKTRATRRKESPISRLSIVLVEIAGYLLIFNDALSIGLLGRRVLPRTALLATVGVVMTWWGIALAIWARYHLGEYWSARITIKEDHQLIRTGPYRRLRHPIYSGLIMAAVGSALLFDLWRCVVGLCLVVAGYAIKARKEEAMLGEQFGEAFREHRKHTGFLFPRFL
jgi:protein-S-isoprenylcysteine O-methyltransferase Ste14